MRFALSMPLTAIAPSTTPIAPPPAAFALRARSTWLLLNDGRSAGIRRALLRLACLARRALLLALLVTASFAVMIAPRFVLSFALLAFLRIPVRFPIPAWLLLLALL
jgi:hypothetical protein